MKKIVVIGGGTMGLDIAQVFAKKGFDVVVRDISDEIIKASEARLNKGLDKLVSKGKMDEAGKKAVTDRITFTTDLNLAADADLVVEAAIENLEIKKSIFAELDKICKPETILASNTSSISITAIAAATKRADRFIGMHFFNPATVMKLIEVIRGANTSDETFQTIYALSQEIGKDPVEVAEAPGFVVNKILVPMINEAIGLVETGVASPEDIDKAMKLGAFGLTEPNAGTDAQGQQTTAELDGDHWVLNGSKIFITNAGFADVFIIFAVTGTKTNAKGRTTKEISAFIVERSFPGFSVGKHERKMGIRGSSTCELIMENCIVPKENLLGKEGKGFALAMKTLDGGRIGIAAQALGLSEGALDETIKYVKERKQFGRTIAAQQNTQFEIADMHTRNQAAQYLVYAAAQAKAAGKPYSKEAAMAKLFAAENASDVTRRCVQLFGGYGYTREYPVERMMRDAKITEIYEGTSEVQRMVISGALGVK